MKQTFFNNKFLLETVFLYSLFFDIGVFIIPLSTGLQIVFWLVFAFDIVLNVGHTVSECGDLKFYRYKLSKCRLLTTLSLKCRQLTFWVWNVDNFWKILTANFMSLKCRHFKGKMSTFLLKRLTFLVKCQLLMFLRQSRWRFFLFIS